MPAPVRSRPVPEILPLPSYAPSGRVRAVRAPIAAALGLAAAGALGWLSAAAAATVGFVAPLLPLITLGIAFALVFVGRAWTHVAHARSVPIAAVAGVLIGVAAQVASFGFLYARYPDAAAASAERSRAALVRQDEVQRTRHMEGGRVVFDPLPVRPPSPTAGELRESVSLPSFFSMRSLGGWEAPGRDPRSLSVVMLALWSLELVLFALAAGLAAAATAKEPYCEACSRFARRSLRRLVSDCDFRALGVSVRAGRIEEVLALPRDVKAGKPVLIEAAVCPGCGDGAWVDASAPIRAGTAPSRSAARLRWVLALPSQLFARRGEDLNARLLERVRLTSPHRDVLFSRR